MRGVPTLLVFRDGQKVASHVGVTSKEKILALLAPAALPETHRAARTMGPAQST